MNRVGIGTRTLNFIVDTFIISLFTFLAYHAWQFYAFYYQTYFFVSSSFDALFLFFAIILTVYYVLFESIFARTPGKWLSLSKVVNKKGTRPSFLQILLRTLVRLTVIDCFFIPFLDKTLHDYLSGTEVAEI
jgi:uncharacterized RDD family membrane protein YckC